MTLAVSTSLTIALASLLVGTASHAASPPSHAHVSAECDTQFDAIAGIGNAAELVTVVAANTSSQHAQVELLVRSGGCLRRTLGPYDAFVGYHGLTEHLQEGDESTPMGLFGIEPTLYGVDPDPGLRYPYHRLVCGDWWDEDPRSAHYNRFVHVGCGTTPPFAGHSEPLWLEAPAYDYLVVVAFNANPVVKGLGSGIFVHVAQGAPTTGCVSLQPQDLIAILRMLQPRLRPLILITTRAVLNVATTTTTTSTSTTTTTIAAAIRSSARAHRRR